MVETVIGIIIAIIPIIKVIESVHLLLKQNHVSLTLLSHSERVKYNMLQRLMILLVSFIFFTFVGIVINCDNFDYYGVEYTIVHIDEQDSVVDGRNREKEKTSISMQEKENSQAYSVIEKVKLLSKVFLLPAVLTWITILIINKSIKETKGKQKNHKIKYREVVTNIFAMYWSLCMNYFIFAEIINSFVEYLLFDLMLSLIAAVSIQFTIVPLNKEYVGERAYLKTTVDGKLLYLFERNGEYLIGGNAASIEECTQYRLVKIEDIKDSLKPVE